MLFELDKKKKNKPCINTYYTFNRTHEKHTKRTHAEF
jgi:hypothetical protein